MGSEDLLVMAMALPPMWVAAKLWWSMRTASAELREFRAFVPGAAETAPRRDAAACSADSRR